MKEGFVGYTYLCSPYSHPDPAVRQRRFERAAECAGKLMLAGESIFCPIAHSHPIDVTFETIQGFDFWMRQDLPILRCAAKVKVLMLDGWKDSRGIARELQVASVAFIPVFYIEPDIEELDEIVRRSAPEATPDD